MATTLFQPYVDKENTGAISSNIKGLGRSSSLSGPVGKTFQSQSFSTPRQALKDVNREMQNVKSGGLKQQPMKSQKLTDMKRPGLQQRKSVQPLGNRSGNIQQINPDKKHKLTVDPQFKKPAVVNRKDSEVEDIEHMAVHKEEEDDFEDIWAKKDRIGTYVHKLIKWRPPCLFGNHPDSDSEPEDESNIITLMEKLDAMPKPAGLDEDPEINTDLADIKLEPLDISIPDLDEMPLPCFQGLDSSTPCQSLDNTLDTLPLVDNSFDLPSLDDTGDILTLSKIGRLQLHDAD